MSANEKIQQPLEDHTDAERGVFALLALVQNPDAFAERIQGYVAARDEAARRLEEASVRDAALTARSREVEALKAQAEDALAVYRREKSRNRSTRAMFKWLLVLATGLIVFHPIVYLAAKKVFFSSPWVSSSCDRVELASGDSLDLQWQARRSNPGVEMVSRATIGYRSLS